VGGHEAGERSKQKESGSGSTQRSREPGTPETKDQKEGETTLPTETFSNQERDGRRARRDRGSHQVSERDVELLGLIAEQYAVTLEQLARLIGRSYRTARGLRDRWCDAGWTASAKLGVTLPQRSPSRSERRPHLPDAVLACPERIAIEVELTLKSRARLQAIVNELSQTYQHVWYFTPDRLASTLTELAEAAPYGNVTVRRYPPLAAEQLQAKEVSA
jgi:DNA-binding CsgD family transcriptional regulator